MLVAVALAALAMLALPAIGIGNDRGHDDAARAAGTIESFDRQTRLLVVDLTVGRKIAGLVVRRTQVRCVEDRPRHRRRQHRRSQRRGHEVNATSSTSRRDNDVVADRPVEAPVPDDDVRGRDGSGTEPDPDERPDPESDRPRHCFDNLVPGAIVLRAEMVLAYGDAYFKRIAVLPPAPVDTPVVPSAE
jgi:hypothetical protein